MSIHSSLLTGLWWSVGGQPLYVWVAVDAVTRQPICLVGCFTHKHHGERAQISAQAEGEVPILVVTL